MAAADRLAGCHRWALLVRARVAADALGVAMLLQGCGLPHRTQARPSRAPKPYARPCY